MPVTISQHLNASICILQSWTESDFARNLQKSHASSRLAGKSAGFLIHFGSLTKIPVPTDNTPKSISGAVTTCKFGQSQNFLNDSSLTTWSSKTSASTAEEKLRVPPSVLGATIKFGQTETRDKLLLEYGL